jgi:hypothetical protein
MLSKFLSLTSLAVNTVSSYTYFSIFFGVLANTWLPTQRAVIATGTLPT